MRCIELARQFCIALGSIDAIRKFQRALDGKVVEDVKGMVDGVFADGRGAIHAEVPESVPVEVASEGGSKDG